MALNAPTMAFHHDDTFLKNKPSQDEHLALCLIMLARGSTSTTATQDVQSPETAPKNNIPPQEARIGSYKCSVCNKVFSSHQALGGHKASHSKPNAASITDKQTNASSISAACRTHKCSVCHKSFPTGQALGGHKRRHYEGHIGNNTNSSSSSGTSGEKSQSQSPSQSQCRGGGGLGFDLNMLPEIDEAEDNGEEFESHAVRKKPRLLGEDGRDDHRE